MADNSGFQCRKWTLFALCLIGLVSSILFVCVAYKEIDEAKLDEYQTGTTRPYEIKTYRPHETEAMRQYVTETTRPDDWKSAQKTLKWIVIAAGAISMLFYNFGLFGACYENFCLTMTFAILMTLATVGSFRAATVTYQPFFGGTFIFSLLITILAYVFARDLIHHNREVSVHAYAYKV